MEDQENILRPEYNGSFLFLVDLALCFKRVTMSRESNNIQILFRNLDAISLMLVGYYDKDDKKGREKEKSLRERLIRVNRMIDDVIKQYERDDVLKIPESVWLELHDLESELRRIWKDSGLQMSMKSRDDLNEY